jgi:hypothetical protein
MLEEPEVRNMVPNQNTVPSTADFPIARSEYELVNANFRQLSEIRFKLLGFVPALGGVANFVLTQAAFSKDSSQGNYLLALVFGSLGFLVTLGIAMYDQRNSEIYFGLIERARFLERHLKLPVNGEGEGGQFLKGASPQRRLFRLIPIWHGGCLAMIYGPVLGAWFLPIIYSLLKLVHRPYHGGLKIAVWGAIGMTIVFIVEFYRLDRHRT